MILAGLWAKGVIQGLKDMVKGFWITKRGILIPLFAGILMVMNQIAPWETTAADPRSESSITCDIQHGACTKEVGGVTVTLDILPKPVKAMKDLKFQVTVSSAKAVRASHIDLGMPGMDMGPNRVDLRPVKDSVYEGQGVIVRCPSGRRTWKAVVTLAEAGKVEFVFDVVY